VPWLREDEFDVLLVERIQFGPRFEIQNEINVSHQGILTAIGGLDRRSDGLFPWPASDGNDPNIRRRIANAPVCDRAFVAGHGLNWTGRATVLFDVVFVIAPAQSPLLEKTVTGR